MGKQHVFVLRIREKRFGKRKEAERIKIRKKNKKNKKNDCQAIKKTKKVSLYFPFRRKFQERVNRERERERNGCKVIVQPQPK